MRTIKKTVLVPERTIEAHEDEEIAYGCDLCDFQSPDEEEVKIHHGEKHAAKETKEIGGRRFVKFEAEADMEAWAEAQCDPHSVGGYDDIILSWQGPGWYAAYGKQVPCGRGCCTNCAICFKSLETLIGDLEWEIARKLEALEDIKLELLPDE